MIYLRRYNESDNNEYYTKLDFDAWVDGAKNLINMNSTAIKILDDFFKKKWNTNKSGEYRTSQKRTISYSQHKSPVEYVAIHECPDEYYYVSIAKSTDVPYVSSRANITTYWKCDQLDGVLELLQDQL
jgi:hypothetical protein